MKRFRTEDDFEDGSESVLDILTPRSGPPVDQKGLIRNIRNALALYDRWDEEEPEPGEDLPGFVGLGKAGKAGNKLRLEQASMKKPTRDELLDLAAAAEDEVDGEEDWLDVEDDERLEYDSDEPDDLMDGDAESALASAGFGTDEDYGDYGSTEDDFGPNYDNDPEDFIDEGRLDGDETLEICPYCDGRHVFEVPIGKNGEMVKVCDDCDETWEDSIETKTDDEDSWFVEEETTEACEPLAEEKSPEDLREEIAAALRMVSNDDPNTVARFEHWIRSEVRLAERDGATLDNEQYSDIAEEFISDMTDESEDYNSLSPEDQEGAGMHRVEAYPFQKMDKVTLGKAIVDFITLKR